MKKNFLTVIAMMVVAFFVSTEIAKQPMSHLVAKSELVGMQQSSLVVPIPLRVPVLEPRLVTIKRTTRYSVLCV